MNKDSELKPSTHLERSVINIVTSLSPNPPSTKQDSEFFHHKSLINTINKTISKIRKDSTVSIFAGALLFALAYAISSTSQLDQNKFLVALLFISVPLGVSCIIYYLVARFYYLKDLSQLLRIKTDEIAKVSINPIQGLTAIGVIRLFQKVVEVELTPSNYDLAHAIVEKHILNVGCPTLLSVLDSLNELDQLRPFVTEAKKQLLII